MFESMNKASAFYPASFDESQYLERTRRNHFWLGGEEGQMELKKLRVGIAGLGGMGSNVAEIMVRLGVGNIKIADPDIIELSNLNRQVIANKNSIGTSKVDASVQELRNIADDYNLVVYNEGITEENAEDFVSDLDVVIDEIDVFPLMAHVWLHREANKRNIPLYSGFIIGLGAHIYKFQGTEFTFEDFMDNNHEQMNEPDFDFLLERFICPQPTAMQRPGVMDQFSQESLKKGVPIFGASTYMAQSLLSLRVLVDQLNLHSMWQVPATPVMPEFLAIDPLDMSFKKVNFLDLKRQERLGESLKTGS